MDLWAWRPAISARPAWRSSATAPSTPSRTASARRIPGSPSRSASTPAALADSSSLRPDHDRAHELVVPALLAVVPEHPQIAQAEREARQEAREVATDRPGHADQLAVVDVDDLDPERHLADRLTPGPFEV